MQRFCSILFSPRRIAFITKRNNTSRYLFVVIIQETNPQQSEKNVCNSLKKRLYEVCYLPIMGKEQHHRGRDAYQFVILVVATPAAVDKLFDIFDFN